MSDCIHRKMSHVSILHQYGQQKNIDKRQLWNRTSVTCGVYNDDKERRSKRGCEW
jgi:hypothetical protein